MSEAAIQGNGFMRTLADIRTGSAAGEASDALQKLITAVRATGKGGTLTVKLKIKPATTGDCAMVTIEDDVEVKLPKPNRAQSLMYTTEDGSLTRQDPRQMEIPLRIVEDKKEIREVPAAKTVNG